MIDDLKNYRPSRNHDPRWRWVAFGLFVLLSYGYAGQDSYELAQEQELQMPILSHPLRGLDCDITITQRGYGAWQPETCAKGRKRNAR